MQNSTTNLSLLFLHYRVPRGIQNVSILTKLSNLYVTLETNINPLCQKINSWEREKSWREKCSLLTSTAAETWGHKTFLLNRNLFLVSEQQWWRCHQKQQIPLKRIIKIWQNYGKYHTNYSGIIWHLNKGIISQKINIVFNENEK